ncbi:MAG: CTP synthase [Chloroflexota bacterium]|jgi:CTP synthase|nr:CTP synthase [Chloroflexota bacterium]
MTRYVFVTGGVVSSVGKGIVTASLGQILKSRGLKVSILKLDPYINVDPGTMSPYQHGEVFVTDDGAETDLDLGHYERFLDVNLSGSNSSSSGQIYQEVIHRERSGQYYEGKTVQAIPHITDEIQRRIILAGETLGAEVVLVEVGGTVGDIEGQVFLEAVAQMRYASALGQTLSVHVTLLPQIGATGELKTKPTQHSVRTLRSFGIQPDLIVTRSEKEIPAELCDKIAQFCNVEPNAVIPLKTAKSIYEVPIMLEALGVGNLTVEKLSLEQKEPDLGQWSVFSNQLTNPDDNDRVRVHVVGKYVNGPDAYLSIQEAIAHAAVSCNTGFEIVWVDAQQVEGGDINEIFRDSDGIVLCPGFDERGVEGKVRAATFARENQIPYLGDCLGMQILVIEFARNVAGLQGAHSTEMNPDTPYPVIDIMEEQKMVETRGGTMRLGGYDCELIPGTRTYEAYGEKLVRERHRHRYEVNNSLLPELEKNGLVVAGRHPERNLVEIVELADHPFMIGAQFHPEFTSRPLRPNPLFRAFIDASITYSQKQVDR